MKRSLENPVEIRKLKRSFEPFPLPEKPENILKVDYRPYATSHQPNILLRNKTIGFDAHKAILSSLSSHCEALLEGDASNPELPFWDICDEMLGILEKLIYGEKQTKIESIENMSAKVGVDFILLISKYDFLALLPLLTHRNMKSFAKDAEMLSEMHMLSSTNVKLQKEIQSKLWYNFRNFEEVTELISYIKSLDPDFLFKTLKHYFLSEMDPCLLSYNPVLASLIYAMLYKKGWEVSFQSLRVMNEMTERYVKHLVNGCKSLSTVRPRRNKQERETVVENHAATKDIRKFAESLQRIATYLSTGILDHEADWASIACLGHKQGYCEKIRGVYNSLQHEIENYMNRMSCINKENYGKYRPCFRYEKIQKFGKTILQFLELLLLDVENKI